jgi:hypothetical protein
LGDLRRLVDLLANSTYQGRRVLLFGFSDNYGGNEVASRPQVTTGVVKTLIHRLRKR